MTEDIKAIWKNIYTFADNLAITNERLKYLVEGILGKRAETAEEANTVLTFLKAVNHKYKGSLLTVDEAIEAVKGYKHRTVDETTDAEMDKIGAELEEERKAKEERTRTEQTERIKTLQVELKDKFPITHLQAYIEKTYGKGVHLEYLTNEQRAELIVEMERMAEAEAEVVEEGEERWDKAADTDRLKEEETKWDKTIETEEGTFMFKDEGTALVLCKNGVNDKKYWLDILVPGCSCPDFQVNKRQREWCKHLAAAAKAGYPVKELRAIPEEVTAALVQHDKEKQKKVKVNKEETVALTILDKQIEMPVQIPSEIIQGEDKVLAMIKGIIGNTPKKDDVIESYAGIEELSADVVLSLASYLGIQYRIVEKEIEKTRMSVGMIYELTATEDQMRKYGAVAKIMPEVDIVTRCKVTVVAAWKDKSGNTRISVGVKEELLTPFELSDIAKRGVNFIETKAITKASKKALLSVMPVTHDGLKSKIKEAYGWV